VIDVIDGLALVLGRDEIPVVIRFGAGNTSSVYGDGRTEESERA
jgi:hypothetical protein